MALNWKNLTAFEAAARHQSFTRAAQELNVQQPAISRRVAALEAEIGVLLIRRTRPRPSLTREGDILLRALSDGFSQVHGAISRIKPAPDRNALRVDTTIGFASCYLIKQLPTFRAAFPGISIELISRDRNETTGTDADIVIGFDTPDRLPGFRKQRIFGETMLAVAHPDLARNAPDSLEWLSGQRLLHLTMGVHEGDWATFFHGTGYLPTAPGSEEKFTSFMVYLQAALNGDGIILGWDTLLRDHFDLGQLAPVTGRRVSSSRGYFAAMMDPSSRNASARVFMDWLGALEPATEAQPA